MKIHSFIEIDISTGEVLRDKWIEYDGPIVELKTSSKTEVPPPSSEELRLADIGARLGEEQLSNIQKQGQFQNLFSQFADPLMQSLFSSLGLSGQGISDPNQPLLSGGAPVSIQPTTGAGGTGTPSRLGFGSAGQPTGQISSDYETGLINQAIEMALASGKSDIDTAFQESLDVLKQNLAPSLGLRPGDTPIIDRGGKLALEATRQKSQLSRGLRGQQAQFLQDLEQRSFSNRAQLLGAIQGGGLGLAGLGGAGNTLGALTAGRTANSSTSGFNPFQTASGVGSLLYGASLFSSKEYKNRIGSVDVFDVLNGLKKLTIHKWKYKGETVEHLGPYAEDFKETFGVGDGKTIHLIDVMGVALASLKAMALQMEKENGKSI